MSVFEEVQERLAEQNPEALYPNGLENALIGILTRCGQEPIACYDYHKCIEIFMSEGMSEEEAVEHFEYNVIGGWVGEGTPAFLWRPENE